MKEAMFYRKKDPVECYLCYRNCKIPKDGWGFCGVRHNIDGTLYAMTYARPCSYAVDPIEKKPFYHFWPGSTSFSIATVGCNLRCLHCFLPGTVVVTDKGAHPIESLSTNFESLKLLTHTGRYREVKNVFKHHFSGRICRIKPFFLPEVACTPEHEIFVTSTPHDGVVEKVEAEKLTKRHFVAVPKTKSFKYDDVLNIKEILLNVSTNPFKTHRRITHDFLERIKNMRAVGLTSRQIGNALSMNPAYVRTLFVKLKRRGEDHLLSATFETKLIQEGNRVRFTNEGNWVPARLKITPSLARLFGLYCAEGCVRKHNKRPNSSDLVFSFGHSEQKLAEEVKTLYKQIFGVNATVRKEQTALKVYVSGTSLSFLFKVLCGSGCYNKKVPPFLFNTSHDIVGAFLKGYFDGDGCFKKDYSDAISVSKQLIIGVCELLLGQGVVPAFYVYTLPKKRKLLGRTVRQNIEYIVRIPSAFDFVKGRWKKKIKTAYVENKDFFFVPIRSISEDNYNGIVYNFEVDKDHTYTANFVAVSNCQNADISQARADSFHGPELAPEDVVELAKRSGCQGISYTYTEPTIFFEYCYDIGRLARKEGLYNNFVTNGYAQPESIKKSKEFLDAARIDLKGDKEHYLKVCGGVVIENVLKCIKDYHRTGMHIEIITLVIEKDNDKKDWVIEMADFLKSLSPDIPWHFTAFYPAYKMMDRPRTSAKTLERMHDWAKEAGMKYVYTGNIPGHKYENTYCPNCGEIAIERSGFSIVRINLTKDKRCPSCSEKIPIVGELPSQ
jgi:pyruvate formate lyase activating enzyme